MLEADLISQEEVPKGGRSKRVRIVYSITKKGGEKFAQLTESVSPQSWDDDNFEVHVAFFSPTSTRNRLRILEGRHRRLKEKAEILRADLERSAVGLDKYLIEWRRHSLETAEREIAWLEEMIQSERKSSWPHHKKFALPSSELVTARTHLSKEFITTKTRQSIKRFLV